VSIHSVYSRANHAEAFGILISIKDPPKEIQLLAMARPALDQIASMVPFLVSHNDEFRKAWGSFPPATGGTLHELAVERLAQAQPSGIWWEMTLP